MLGSSSQEADEAIRSLAKIFLDEAVLDLTEEHVLPASRYRPYLHVGTDYEGPSLMAMASFTALEKALQFHFSDRFKDPLTSTKPEFPNHYIFRMLESFISQQTRARYVGGPNLEVESDVIEDLLAGLRAEEYTVVAARVVSHMSSLTNEPVEIGDVTLYPLAEPVFQNPPLAIISRLIPNARWAFKDGPPFAYDPPICVVTVRASGQGKFVDIEAQLTGRIERFLLLTRLIHGATTQSHWQITGATTPNSEAITVGSAFVQDGFAFQFIQRTANVASGETQAFAALGNLLDSAQVARNKMFTTSFDMAMNRFTRTYSNNDLLDAFVDFATTMEAILVSGGSSNEDVGLRLRLRAAALLATDDDPSRKIFADVGRLYNIRSKLVHGGALAIKDLEKDLRNLVPNYESVGSRLALSFALDRFRDLARRAILARLALASGDKPLWPFDGDTPVDSEMADDEIRQTWRAAWRSKLTGLGLAQAIDKARPATGFLEARATGETK
jgi:hypothetical protein